MRKLYFFLVCIIFTITVVYAQNPLPELYLKGMEELKAKNFTAAEKSFYQSIMQNKDKDSYYQLAKLYFPKREPVIRNQGYEYSAQALRLDPDNLEYNYLYLDYLLWFGKQGKREEEYWKIFNNDPKQVLALFKIAEIRFLNFEKYRAEKVDTERWFRDEDLQSFNLAGFVKADLDTAEILYLKGLEIDPANRYGLFGIIKMYQSTLKPEKAIYYLQQLIRYHPNDKEGHLQLGVYYYKKKMLDASFKEMEIAIKLMDGEEKEDYVYNSVIQMLEPKYQEPFKKMNKEEKNLFVEKYWKSLDPFYLSNYNERIMEHYARIAYSNIFFSVPEIDLIGWKSDRGQVYIRYGEPDRKERIKQGMKLDSDVRNIGLVSGFDPGKRTGSAVRERRDESNIINPVGIPATYVEIWEYENLPGFCFTGDKNYYKFMVSNEIEETWRKSWKSRTRGGAPSALDSRSTINSQKDYENVKMQKIQTYKPVIDGNRIELDTRIYNFNKLTSVSNGIVETYIAYALPSKDIEKKKDIKDFTHEIGVFLFDQNYNPVIQVKDTVWDADIRDAFPDKNNDMIKCIGFGVKPRKVSFAFEMKRIIDTSYYTYRRLFEIPDFSNQTIGISDLVLANKIELEKNLPFGIKRGDISFYPKLSNKFGSKEQFYIYYEAYNLGKDDKKETNFEQTITIKPKGEDGFSLKKVVKGITNLLSGEEGKISLTTDYRTQEENTQVYLQLDISEYKTGKYDLIITVNDKITGKTVEKKTDLEIF